MNMRWPVFAASGTKECTATKIAQRMSSWTQLTPRRAVTPAQHRRTTDGDHQPRRAERSLFNRKPTSAVHAYTGCEQSRSGSAPNAHTRNKNGQDNHCRRHPADGRGCERHAVHQKAQRTPQLSSPKLHKESANHLLRGPPTRHGTGYLANFMCETPVLNQKRGADSGPFLTFHLVPNPRTILQ